MSIRFQTVIKVNLKAVLKDCTILVPEVELKKDIKSIVLFWAEKRLKEDGWPVPNSTKDIREYLLENDLICENSDIENDPTLL
ncbi:MAG: hypothetical protein K0S39_2541 [Paenibacillus sp.]|jgi:hypothetical protein|nr:hypothetical protein [Paenibacillus sp.]